MFGDTSRTTSARSRTARRTAAVSDPDTVIVSFGLRPYIAAAPDGRAGYRYRVDVAVGSLAVERRGAASVVDAVVSLADALKLRAGAVFPAASASFAHALASG